MGCYANPTDLASAKTAPSTYKHASLPLTLKIRINPGDINFTIHATTAHTIYQIKQMIYEETKEVHLRYIVTRTRFMYSSKRQTGRQLLCVLRSANALCFWGKRPRTRNF